MNINNLPILNLLGWTLLHSLWQITVVAGFLFVALRLARRASANSRYVLACAALGLTLLLPAATFLQMANSPTKIESHSAGSPNSNQQLRLLNADRQQREASDFVDSNTTASGETQLWNLTFSELNLERFLPLLVWLWFAGVTIFAARTAGGLWHLRILRKQSTKNVNGEQQRKFAALCGKIGVAATIKISESAIIAAPIVVGWLKPVVLVPSSALLGLSPQQLETVLIHELIHIRRHDFLINLAQTAIEIILFYHPCVWLVSNEIRNLREFAADDAVVKFDGGRLNYAQALANLETLRSNERGKTPRLAAAATGGKLMNRIQRILNKETEIRRANSLWSAGLAVVLISAFGLILLSAGGTFSVNAERKTGGKKMAVGFVSLPPVDRTDNPPQDSAATMRLLIEKLKSHRVPAIGFVLGAAISDGDKLSEPRADIVRSWRDAGFEIGIGNYQHVWFYDTPFNDYAAGVEKNERIVKPLLAEKNLKLRYFSYPFLNTGKTIEDKTRMENWLRERGLQSIKYTFDNSEWLYSFAYDMARKNNDEAQMRRVKTEFLDYMTRMTDHYEAYSAEMFRRDIPQTMVLTPSRLVAESADELFGMLETRGYEFVSVETTQADEAYKTPENFVGVKAGISWFERWTMAQGKKLRAEPTVSKFVEEVWEAGKRSK